METNVDEKLFFRPGDVVTIRLNIPNKPIMIVVKKVNNMIGHTEDKDGVLRGIRCRWFTSTGTLQEEIFNTKDLELIKN